MRLLIKQPDQTQTRPRTRQSYPAINISQSIYISEAVPTEWLTELEANVRTNVSEHWTKKRKIAGSNSAASWTRPRRLIASSLSIHLLTQTICFALYQLYPVPDNSATYRADGKNNPLKHDAKSLTDEMDRMQDLKGWAAAGPLYNCRRSTKLLTLVIAVYVGAWQA